MLHPQPLLFPAPDPEDLPDMAGWAGLAGLFAPAFGAGRGAGRGEGRGVSSVGRPSWHRTTPPLPTGILYDGGGLTCLRPFQPVTRYDCPFPHRYTLTFAHG